MLNIGNTQINESSRNEFTTKMLLMIATRTLYMPNRLSLGYEAGTVLFNSLDLCVVMGNSFLSFVYYSMILNVDFYTITLPNDTFFRQFISFTSHLAILSLFLSLARSMPRML